MDLVSAHASQEYAALVRSADDLLVGLDFDGTLAPIVADPEQAHIHPDAPEVLVRLARQVHAVAIVTGRPARQVLALGGLEEVGEAIGADGRELVVLGQYGNERWSSQERRIVAPPPPRGLASLTAELPALLRQADAADAWIEEKGLAVAVHTRRLSDPKQALERIRTPLADAARARDLVLEPGRDVIEIRAAGMDKGRALTRLAEGLGARAVLFAGDDLGDVEAFRAVRRLRGEGIAGVTVASGPPDSELAGLADILVAGPAGVLDLLRTLTRDIRSARA